MLKHRRLAFPVDKDMPPIFTRYMFRQFLPRRKTKNTKFGRFRAYARLDLNLSLGIAPVCLEEVGELHCARISREVSVFAY